MPCICCCDILSCYQWGSMPGCSGWAVNRPCLLPIPIPACQIHPYLLCLLNSCKHKWPLHARSCGQLWLRPAKPTASQCQWYSELTHSLDDQTQVDSKPAGQPKHASRNQCQLIAVNSPKLVLCACTAGGGDKVSQ